MMNRLFVEPGAFDPGAIEAMSEALDAACERLGDIDQPEVVREIMAVQIITVARFGERNPARLLQAALRGRDCCP
jgi:hypothetical protein